jgi:uncharacterized protein YjiS (DUF1127 family)
MTVHYLKQPGLDTQSIERLLEANRKQLLMHWNEGVCGADAMFTVVKFASKNYIQSSRSMLESLAKRLMLFLRATRDRQAILRLIPSIRAYRQGRRDQAELRKLLEREIEGLLIEDSVRLGLEQGIFCDLGHSINLTPTQSFETLYPKRRAP